MPHMWTKVTTISEVREVHPPSDTAVFVDHSGRRARFLMIIGIVAGTLLIACMAILIGGAFSGTSLTVIGWPGDGPQAPQVPHITPSRSPAESPSATPRPERSTRPTAGGSPSLRRTPTAHTPTPTPRRTIRPTPSVRPDPTASATPTEPPVDDPTAEPTPSEPVPPGKTKQPPGLDPDKTQGPKR
ncbi:hypothetical protein Sme01_68600 [Sphaerisporangium melleum]|uniref:Uncharacterized protein n=1 Tax=Sphaerisporangium melleum TaxID=321316 RepID=A0A917RLF3_9ACTN|nr:hypothetical protein GCM10007964_62630 [Sphaerisporangium melleum]GII74384.1 hypothetical protein Sme01_68600 [Sphaerisporangium melleum]